eukprot:363618-Chlamydomonas_euryale.AAC.7
MASALHHFNNRNSARRLSIAEGVCTAGRWLRQSAQLRAVSLRALQAWHPTQRAIESPSGSPEEGERGHKAGRHMRRNGSVAVLLLHVHHDVLYGAQLSTPCSSVHPTAREPCPLLFVHTVGDFVCRRRPSSSVPQPGRVQAWPAAACARASTA